MAKSSTRKRGNIEADDGFLEWMKDHGGLVVIDSDKLGLPFSCKTMWTKEEDDHSPWKIPPGEGRCTGKAYVRTIDGEYVVDAKKERIMRPCYNWPIRGAQVCVYHGGGFPRVRQAAHERLLGALDLVTRELVEMALSPATEQKVKVQAINSVLDRAGLKAGIEVEVKAPGYEDVLRGLFERPGSVDDEDDEGAPDGA